MKGYPFCLITLLIAASVFPLFALNGQVIAVSGKVEIQSGSGAWKPLKAGDALSAGSMISTGFKSEATIKLGASILTVRPLTRMTLNQLVEKEDVVDTEVYLEVGNVKAEVNSLNNKKNGFTVKSPVATASVRGTIVEVGDDLFVFRGSAQYISAVGQRRKGSEGQRLELFDGAVASPIRGLIKGLHAIRLTTTPISEIRSPILATCGSPAPVTPDAGASGGNPTMETVTAFIVE